MSSQHGQDEYVLTALRGLRGGFFLDSGASGGIRCSNTEVLERRYEWTGICVEPDPVFFQQLTQARSCVCVNCCLYSYDGAVPFVHAGTISGVLDELTPELLPHVRAQLGLANDAPLPFAEVPCRTAASLLGQYGAPRVIDYWSLDTEGSELTILRHFPFDRYLVRMLTVEHNWGADRRTIHRLLAGHGFLRAAELECDDVYVHRSVTDRDFGWRSRALARRSVAAP